MNEAASRWTSRGKCVSLLMGNNPVIEGHSASEGPETPPSAVCPPPHPQSHRLGKRQSPGWALDSPSSSTRWRLCPLGWEGRPPKVSTPSQRCPRTRYTVWKGGLCRRHQGHQSKNGETLDLLGGPILITGTLKSREPSPAGSRRDGRRGGQRSGHEDPACC